jgi:EmrB/QacA subfamily drug resistance transporter
LVDRKWITLSNTTVGTFMALLDTSIVLVALPTIGRDLAGTSPEVLLWVVLTYSLVMTTLLLSLGRLSDMFGRARLYTLGFAIFTVGSAMSSLAPDGEILLGARVVQGVGAGLLSANSAALITDAFAVNERGRALGLNQVAAISGSMMGLVIGGLLTSALGWRSIFWVNIPIGTFGTIWSYYQLPKDKPNEHAERIDWRGNIAFALGITLFLAGITLGGLYGWTSPLIITLIVVGLALLLVFAFWERIIESPLMDLTLFRIRTFTFGNTAAFLSALARGAFSFIMVFYFQGVVGLSPFDSGLLLIPLSIAFMIFGPLSGAISDRTGARGLGTAGLLVSALGFFMLIFFPANGPYWELVISMVLLGIGQGLFASPNRAEVMSSVPPERRGVASAISMTVLQAGNLGSLALGFTVLAGVVPRSTLSAVFAGLGSAGVTDVGSFMVGLHILFAVSLGITLLGAWANWVRGTRQING